MRGNEVNEERRVEFRRQLIRLTIVREDQLPIAGNCSASSSRSGERDGEMHEEREARVKDNVVIIYH